MRILYIDIDSLRPDHLGCYGYHRNTSPHLDRIAREGVRFQNVHASDVPCLPSRTALFTGRFGIHTGVINHGGTAADPFQEGPPRRFRDRLSATAWMSRLRQAGYRTVTVSPFGERHSAWHWYAGFNEVYNPGKNGNERADEVAPYALDWIRRNGKADNWFLHVNFWDPHTPYRTPLEYGNPFEGEPIPAWLTEEVRQQHWNGVGPHSAQEITGYAPAPQVRERFPRQPIQADSMEAVRAMFDGYDTGIRYADDHVGLLLEALEEQGVLDETAIIVSADHGENLGELNIYGDHQTADQITTHVPLILRWPGVTDAQAGRVDRGLYYQVDMAATVVELAGGSVPPIWDGRSFAESLRAGREGGRDYLVLSQGAWSCQRAVRFDRYLVIRSYHEGYHGLPEVLCFDVENDPHEQYDLAPTHPELVERGLALLEAWTAEMMRTATHPVDPMWISRRELPLHLQGALPGYLKRLRETGRERWAEWLEARYPQEAQR
ncbi:MAG: sulfatase [Candidatus Poribacteria bacterium]|nr:MAG: sulfatase [Candidatus Poribacteria bacterium]